MSDTPAVDTSGISRRYGKVAAVDDLSLRIEQGEFFALLGPNGAGKTTLLHMLITVTPPSAGRARVMGHDVVKEATTVRQTIGVVFQDPALDDRLTAWENLEFHAVLYGIPRSRRRPAIEEALAWASLTDVGKRRCRTFSGGMKRRLELARALMHRPRILFLDEPTLGLDPQGRRDLWERIAAMRQEGVTVLMTTHNLLEAHACDRVGIIDHGKLIALGTPQALIQEHAKTDDANLEDVFIQLTGRRLRDDPATARDQMISFANRGGEHTR